jgi:hypothetical protein
MREPKIDLIAKLLVQQRSRRRFLRTVLGVLIGAETRQVADRASASSQSQCSFIEVLCPASFGGYECVNTSRDAYNCGGCGNECIGGSSCEYGQCVCGFGEEGCIDRYGGAECTNISNDPSNCGGCGVTCPNGSSCHVGICECGFGNSNCPDSTKCQNGDCDCQVWQTLCPVNSFQIDFDFWCVNTNDDSSNCGDCGVICPPGSYCIGGRCTCRLAMTLCPAERGNQECVDMRSDINNCGGCENQCPNDGRCDEGICVARPSDQALESEGIPFGVDKVTNSELTVEAFGEFLPRTFAGHELIANLDKVSREAELYPGLIDSTMYLYMDPAEPNVPYAVAVGNVSILPGTENLPRFMKDLLSNCSPSIGCEELQTNVGRSGRVTYVFLSYLIEDETELFYSLVWGETNESLVYTLEAFSQQNIENLVHGFVNNALAAMNDSVD